MKKINKKGYILIEIIAVVALIAVISTITIVSLNKKDKTQEELKAEYVEAIKLDAAVYYENNKNTQKFSMMKNSGDWGLIQLKDLIALGVLGEEENNPFYNLSSGESDFDCVKVFLDEDLNIDIEYPVSICETQIKESIKEEDCDTNPSSKICETKKECVDDDDVNVECICKENPKMCDEIIKDNIVSKKNAFIHLEGDVDYGEYITHVTIPNSANTLENLNKGTFPVDYIEKLQKGQIDYYEDEGYKLLDYNNSEIEVDEFAWEIERIINKTASGEWDMTWDYVYSIKDGEYDGYEIVNNGEPNRTVYLEDIDPPILVYNNYSEFGQDDSTDLDDYFYVYDENGYMKYINDNKINNFKIFDNFDGFSTDIEEKFNNLNFSFNSNSVEYVLSENRHSTVSTYNINVIKKVAPTIIYSGGSSYYLSEVYIQGTYIHPFADYIYYDSNGGEIDYIYHRLSDSDGNTCYNDQALDCNFSSGDNTLYIEACNIDKNGLLDTNDICSSDSYSIYLDPGEDSYIDDTNDSSSNDYGGSYECNAVCIVNKMTNNSEAWDESLPQEEKDRLHDANVELAQQYYEVTGETLMYNNDGYWQHEDGTAVYIIPDENGEYPDNIPSSSGIYN